MKRSTRVASQRGQQAVTPAAVEDAESTPSRTRVVEGDSAVDDHFSEDVAHGQGVVELSDAPSSRWVDSKPILPPAPPAHPRLRRQHWWRPALPWTVYRYVTAEILRVFILGNVAVSLVYSTLITYQTVRSGLQISLVWPLIVKTFAYPLYYSVPISLLFGVTLVIGRMVGDLEITALRTHGVSHRHVYGPVIALGLCLAGLSYYLNGWIVPHIHYEKRNIHKYVMEQLESLGSGENRRLQLPDRGTLWIGQYRGTELRKVHISLNTSKNSSLSPVLRQHLPEGLPQLITIFAREGSLDLVPEASKILLSLRGVVVLVPQTVRSGKVANEKFHQSFSISETVVIPLRFDRKRPGLKDRTSPELAAFMTELTEAALDEAARPPLRGGAETEELVNKHQKRFYEAQTDWHRRLAFTISCVTFPLVGISLALLLHGRSRLVPFFLANLVIIGLFYPLLMVGVSLGDSGWFPPIALAIPNVVLLVLGVVLTRKVVEQ